MKIKEIVGAKSVVNMNYPTVTIPERGVGYKFMAAEAWWILSGRCDVDGIAPFSKEISKFSDDGSTFFGAYGPKVVQQLQYVVNTLKRDRDSRQAVINIWRENPPMSKDIPCTLSAQFLIRENRLHCIDTMRSSDAWLGWVYDVFNFSMLSAYVAIHLRQFPEFDGLELGNLILHMGSAHIYEKNLPAIEAILNKRSTCVSVGRLQLNDFPAPWTLIEHLSDLAHGVKPVKSWATELYRG